MTNLWALFKAKPAGRSSTLAHPEPWLKSLWGGDSEAGIPVDQDTALNFSSVYRAVSLIAWSLAACPAHLFRRVKGRREPVDNHPGAELYRTSPRPDVTSFSFRSHMDITALLWGNSYARIIRDGSFRPVALEYHHPTRVRVEQGRAGRVYTIIRTGADDLVEPWYNMIHFSEPFSDGLKGISPIKYARNSFGLGLAGENLHSASFKKGTFLNGTLSLPEGETLGDTTEDAENQIAIYRKSFSEVYGGAGGFGGIAILEDGMELKPLSMPLKDAELLMTRRFQNLEVARWYGLPPHKLGDMDGAKYNNLEQQAIEFVQDAIMPRALQREQELTLKLTTDAERQAGHYFKINTDALIRADIKSRYEAYAAALGSSSPGFKTVQEVRDLEDLNEAAPGDLWHPSNMQKSGA